MAMRQGLHLPAAEKGEARLQALLHLRSAEILPNQQSCERHGSEMSSATKYLPAAEQGEARLQAHFGLVAQAAHDAGGDVADLVPEVQRAGVPRQHRRHLLDRRRAVTHRVLLVLQPRPLSLRRTSC